MTKSNRLSREDQKAILAERARFMLKRELERIDSEDAERPSLRAIQSAELVVFNQWQKTEARKLRRGS